MITVEQIKMARTAAGLSMREAAEMMGIHHLTLNYIETGKSSPRKTTLERLLFIYTTEGIEFGPDGWIRVRPRPEPLSAPQTSTPPEQHCDERR